MKDTAPPLPYSVIERPFADIPLSFRPLCFEANVGARRFYDRHGFAATGSTAGDNEEGAPDVRYDWSPEATAP